MAKCRDSNNYMAKDFLFQGRWRYLPQKPRIAGGRVLTAIASDLFRLFILSPKAIKNEIKY